MNTLASLVSAAGFPVFLFALFGTAESAWAEKVTQEQRQKFRNIFFVLFGEIAVIFHLNTSVGVNLDIRGSAIAISLLFGGTGVGLMTTLVEGLTRYFWEGDGNWVEELRIVADFLAAYLVLNVFFRKQPANLMKISSAGLAVGMSESLTLLLIASFPVALETLKHYGLELFSFNVLATMIFGGLLHQQDARLAAGRLLVGLNRRLKQQFEQSIESLGSAILHRDPSTANHQRRVGDIAAAIAREMNLDESQQECLRIAGLLHDIGQIEIPAEILNRARALTVEEFELIKSHAESGVEILKGIDFSCDVSEIVHQHHENIDGSGYPRGLRDEEILLGARIIRVADSLEAMLSHRPFRQAHDVQYALGELENGSGNKYDAEVVQACRRLILNRVISL